MSEGAPVLAGFDPGPVIRRTVRGQERHLSRLRAASRDLARFAGMRDGATQAGALEARLSALRRSLWISPYYCRALGERGLSPNDLRTLADLRHFPLLDRETLGNAFAELPALPPRHSARLFVDRSSGSTGRPVSVLKEDYDSVHMWAVLRFWMRRLGRRLPARPRIALLCPLPHGVEYWTPLPALGGGTLVRISLAKPEPAARLHAFRPHVVFTDPAGLHWLAGLPRPPRPRLLLSSAMPLSPAHRRRAEEVLGVPVLNYYSSAETGPIAWECASAGRFHVLLPDAWVESVEGEIVVTRLRESVLPLLRYRMGDQGGVAPDACPCGYRGLSIAGLCGRSPCAFVTPAGGEVDAWPLAWAFQHHPLDGFRLTQVAGSAFRLELAGEDGSGGAILERLRASLVSLGWPEPTIEWRHVPRQILTTAKPAPFLSSRGPSMGGARGIRNPAGPSSPGQNGAPQDDDP